MGRFEFLAPEQRGRKEKTMEYKIRVWFTDGSKFSTEDQELVRAFMETYDQDQADEGSPAVMIARIELQRM
jgi:hypothetical protein